MSRLEKVSLKCESLSMLVRGSLNIPECPPPISRSTEEEAPGDALSPTNSVDSGRWTGTAIWPSNKYFVYGGPGFSIGILDSTSGSLERLPVPVPTLSFLEAADASNFSLSEVTCLTLAGESQVWAGTEAGSLHVFDLSTQYGAPRLMNHGYSKLPEAVSYLHAEPLSPGRAMSLLSRERRSLVRTEVLVGSANNTLTVISGEADERGGLRNVAGCPRKVIHLLYRKEEENSCDGVHSIALVSASAGILGDCYWCACGSNIVIVRRSNLKIVKILDNNEKSSGIPTDSTSGYVSRLEPTDYGVWCAVNLSPTVSLWDTTDFSLKLKISCINAGPEALLMDRNAQVTCLVYCDPFLLVGTRGGCLLVLSIQAKHHLNRIRHSSVPDVVVHSLPNSPRPHSRRKLSYTVVTSSRCYPAPITSIHPIPVGGMAAESPYLGSPSNALNMLVVFGADVDNELAGASESVVHVYELTSSPLASPMTSPNTAPGRTSTTSLPPPNRKCSLQDLDAMPKLSLHRVNNDAISYLPLHENSVW